MQFIFLIISILLIIIALILQWRDCVKGYGNTMGAIGLYNVFWIMTSISMIIYLTYYVGVFLSILIGVIFFISHFGIVYIVEKIGLKYK